MKLTKEDFMRLPKERLAELLVEAQGQVRIETVQVPTLIPSTSPFPPYPWTPYCSDGQSQSSHTYLSKEEAETKVWN